MVSELNPDECRRRLKEAPTSQSNMARLWVGRGDANFAKVGVRTGSLLEMHVRVSVKPSVGGESQLLLRFSGGMGTAIVLSMLIVGCIGAFSWALLGLARGGGWVPIYGAALLSILVPILWVLALRAAASDDEHELWTFVADQVGGRGF